MVLYLAWYIFRLTVPRLVLVQPTRTDQGKIFCYTLWVTHPVGCLPAATIPISDLLRASTLQFIFFYKMKAEWKQLLLIAGSFCARRSPHAVATSNGAALHASFFCSFISMYLRWICSVTKVLFFTYRATAIGTRLGCLRARAKQKAGRTLHVSKVA